MLLFSCQQEEKTSHLSKKEMEQQIDSLKQNIFQQPHADNQKKALALAELMEKYAKEYPESEKTPEYLFKAGEIYGSLKKSDKALEVFQLVYVKYPEFPKRATALFMQAFIYDEGLQQYGKAESLYRKFIETYPDHELYDDAQAALKFLGKSDEEIIKEFEQMQKTKEDSIQ
jgi:TolA-binding protein